MSFVPMKQEPHGQLWFTALLVPLIPIGILVRTMFDDPKGPAWLGWVVRALLVGLAIGAWQVFSRPRFRELRRRKAGIPAVVSSAEPDPWDIPERSWAEDVWGTIIVPPVFAILVLGTWLMSTPQEGHEWSRTVLVLLGTAFLGVWVVAMSRPRLLELARRGNWVPPGTTRFPVLVAIAVPVLVTAAVGAAVFVTISGMRILGLLS